MRKLTPDPHANPVWGTPDTEPWFRNPERTRIGEVWFRVDETDPVLVKLLFTSEDLSVQVHPGDCEGKRGKTEMWHVLRAAEGARVGIGLRRDVTADELRAASLDGSIVDLLNWMPTRVGDTFFIPAGTVHVLGAGIVVCEVQQNSNCTYRMFDFGRRPDLQVEQGVEVSELRAHGDPRVALPFECEYFRVGLDDERDSERLAVGIDGERAGECWALDSGEPAHGLFPDERGGIVVRIKRR